MCKIDCSLPDFEKVLFRVIRTIKLKNEVYAILLGEKAFSLVFTLEHSTVIDSDNCVCYRYDDTPCVGDSDLNKNTIKLCLNGKPNEIEIELSNIQLYNIEGGIDNE